MCIHAFISVYAARDSRPAVSGLVGRDIVSTCLFIPRIFVVSQSRTSRDSAITANRRELFDVTAHDGVVQNLAASRPLD